MIKTVLLTGATGFIGSHALDISQAIYRLNWKPSLNIDQTIQFTVDWYKNFYEKQAEMRNTSFEQIGQYCRIAREKKVMWADEN